MTRIFSRCYAPSYVPTAQDAKHRYSAGFGRKPGTPADYLNNHIKSAHNGVIDTACNGCKELQERVKKAGL